MSGLDLDVVVEEGGWPSLGDVEALGRRAVEAALAVGEGPAGAVGLTLLLTDDAAVRELNREWRGLDKPTNVLSFPAGDGPGPDGTRFLGDIALAYETLVREAEEEGKPLAHHATHLIVHGTLHLLGFDHEDDEEAQEMEAREVEALGRLGVPDPYADAP